MVINETTQFVSPNWLNDVCTKINELDEAASQWKRRHYGFYILMKASAEWPDLDQIIVSTVKKKHWRHKRWTYHVSTADVSEIDHDIHHWSPEMNFPLPWDQRGQRHHEQEGPVKLVFMEHVAKETDGLDGLAQAHLISKDATVASGNYREAGEWIKALARALGDIHPLLCTLSA